MKLSIKNIKAVQWNQYIADKIFNKVKRELVWEIDEKVRGRVRNEILEIKENIKNEINQKEF